LGRSVVIAEEIRGSSLNFAFDFLAGNEEIRILGLLRILAEVLLAIVLGKD